MCDVIILGSFDFIRRKSIEVLKREKFFSFVERFKKEFGFEDLEDESGKDGKGIFCEVVFFLVCVCGIVFVLF